MPGDTFIDSQEEVRLLERVVLSFATATTPWTSSYILISDSDLNQIGRTGSVAQHMEQLELNKQFEFASSTSHQAFDQLQAAYEKHRIWFITHPFSWIRNLSPYLEKSKEEPL